MNTYSVHLPSYTIGAADVYEKIPKICGAYGRKIAIIGGKTALSKAEDAIRAGLQGSDFSITGVFWYGGDACYDNINALCEKKEVQEADMIFGVGGGRALDTVKVVTKRLKKPMFAFPTIASNCAPTTMVAVIYNSDHTFHGLEYPETPPTHTFINTKIISEAPREYIWAGIGDALSKQYESSFSARGRDLPHSDQLGVDIGSNCAAPLLRYGKKAMDDVDAGRTSYELTQVILNIIVTTGLVSVLVDQDYNSAVAHSIYYASTMLPAPEDGSKRLHGQVVAYGVLVQLAVDKQFDQFADVYAFNKSIGLPTCLADIYVDETLRDKLIEHALYQDDLSCVPYPVTREMFDEALTYIENYQS